jgi:hypothetical protein
MQKQPKASNQFTCHRAFAAFRQPPPPSQRDVTPARPVVNRQLARQQPLLALALQPVQSTGFTGNNPLAVRLDRRV